MALIKCPECQKEVSTSAEACPHCGFPIKQSLNEEKSTAPKPLEDSWMDYWKLASTKRKFILSFIFAANIVVFIVLFICFGMVINEDGALAVQLLAWDIIIGFFSIVSFAFWLAGLICIKTRSSKCDGYNVIAVSGIWNNYLVIENKVFDKTHNRHLEGSLPNGKRVVADFSMWDSSITITIDR